MPNYLFQKVGNNTETTEIFYSMKDVPPVGTEVAYAGARWKRIFTVPTANIDTRLDPFSFKDFHNKTGNKGDTVGALWDRSREMSEKRADKNGGIDPIKEKYFKEYKSKRRGTPHMQELASNHKKANDLIQNAIKKLA